MGRPGSKGFICAMISLNPHSSPMSRDYYYSHFSNEENGSQKVKGLTKFTQLARIQTHAICLHAVISTAIQYCS